MITQWLFNALLSFINSMLGFLPTSGPPDWWTGASDKISTLWGYGAGLGAWIPWSIALVCAAGVLVVAAISFGIKLVRIIASFLTLGGGSAS